MEVRNSKDGIFEGKPECAATCGQVERIADSDNNAFLMATLAYKMGLERGRADGALAAAKGEG